MANSEVEAADDGDSETECIRYSSNSYTYYFRTSYTKAEKLGTLHFKLLTERDK